MPWGQKEKLKNLKELVLKMENSDSYSDSEKSNEDEESQFEYRK